MGKIEVGEVTLIEPKIVLEVNAEGKPNWEFAPSVAEAKPAAAKPSSPRPLSLGRLDRGWVVASETAALDIVGAGLERTREDRGHKLGFDGVHDVRRTVLEGDSGVILTAGARSSRPRMSGAISASTRYALAASRAMPRGMAQMAFLRFWRTRSCMEYSVPVTSDG